MDVEIKENEIAMRKDMQEAAAEMLEAAGIKKIPPDSYLHDTHTEAVFCQLGPQHYTRHRRGVEFDFKEFVERPQNFQSAFYPFITVTDVFIGCHFWDPRSPVFFTVDQIRNSDFRIRFIADISCDIDGPIPTTIRTSTLEEPFYGIDRLTGKETDPFGSKALTVMAVDNLPCGIPRDASRDFGNRMVMKVMPELIGRKSSEMIENATILKDGKLTSRFGYPKDFLSGKLYPEK